MKIIIRPFDKITDLALIYGTLIRGMYFGAVKKSTLNLGPFTQSLRPYVQDMVENAKIAVVCDMQNPNFLLAYSIIHNNKLQWIFVKPLYRNQGIATMLIKNEKLSGINENNLTTAGQKILKKHNITSKKEEQNEQNLRELN